MSAVQHGCESSAIKSGTLLSGPQAQQDRHPVMLSHQTVQDNSGDARFTSHANDRPTDSNAAVPAVTTTGSNESDLAGIVASGVGPVPESVPVPVSAPAPARSNYADASTQYSPDGLPPTARRSVSTARGQAHGHGHKRKQDDADQDEVMVTSPRAPIRPQPEGIPHDTADTTPVNASASASNGNARSVETLDTDAENKVAHASPVQKPLTSALTSTGQGAADAADALSPASTVATVSKRSKSGTSNPKLMPEQYETCEAKDLGVLIANMLLELIRLNDDLPLRNGKLTRFHSRAPPAISCHDYLLRLIQHATLSPPILLSMVFYIDRLCALYPAFTVNSLTVHRFLIAAATVASKGLSDSFWTNVTYARIGGISTSELATLELDFLQRVEYRIVPRPEVLVDYYRSLVQRSPGYVLENSRPAVQSLGSGEGDSGVDVDMAG